VWFEAGGGWIEQRVFNDALRAVAGSSLVLTPISIFPEVRTDPRALPSLRLLAGPGVYFGIHAAHMHPTLRGEDVDRHRPITEMYPLESGIGPGGRVEVGLTIARHFSLEGNFVVAPFLVGGPTHETSPDISPLDFERHGSTVW